VVDELPEFGRVRDEPVDALLGDLVPPAAEFVDVLSFDQVLEVVADRLGRDADHVGDLLLADRRLAVRYLDEDLVLRRVALVPEDRRTRPGRGVFRHQVRVGSRRCK